MSGTRSVKIAILGAGTAGMAAYREARKSVDSIALVDPGPLGTTCARVGCMPSKLLIAPAEAAHRAARAGGLGVHADGLRVDGVAVMARLRAERDRFVGFVLDAVEGFDPHHLVRSRARFAGPHTLVLDDGSQIEAERIVIATGSRPNVPPGWAGLGDRLLTNEDLFDWDDLPASVAVVGTGVVGLELGQSLHRLGVRIRLFGRGGQVGPLGDPAVQEAARAILGAEFQADWNSELEVQRDGNGVLVRWKGSEERFDYLLAATGRRPNVDSLGLETSGLELDARGVPSYDPLSLQAGTSHVFVAGDVLIDVPLLHEAVDEGRVAGENAARWPEVYKRARRTPLGIVFTDPGIAIAGAGWSALTASGADFAVGEVDFEDQGRARVMLANSGLLRVYGERGTGRLLGAEMIAPGAEHLAHLIAWAIESRLTISEALERPFYHPVVEEGLRTALRHLNHELGFGPNPPLRCIDCGPGS